MTVLPPHLSLFCLPATHIQSSPNTSCVATPSAPTWHWLWLQLLWRFNKEAVALRIQYLMNSKEGAESHTVLVTDIPVLEFGTIPHRIETTVFRYLPVRIKVGQPLSGCTSTICKSANFAESACLGDKLMRLVPKKTMWCKRCKDCICWLVTM